MKFRKMKILTIISTTAIGISLLLGLSTSTREMKLNSSNALAVVPPGGTGDRFLEGGKGSNFTAGDAENENDMTTMYDYVPDGYTYCAGYNWQIVRNETGTSDGQPIPMGGVTEGFQETEYVPHEEVGTNGRTEMAQSIAYALYYRDAYGVTNEQIQNLVWLSEDWASHLENNETCLVDDHEESPERLDSNSNANIYRRSYRFAEFVYNGLNQDTETLGLKGSPTSDTDSRLRIMVDQDKETYTVGPYNIWFDNDTKALEHGNGPMRDLVYDEITHNYDGKFISGVVKAKITYQDGSTQIASIGSGYGQIQVLDANGDVVSQNFPKFGRENEEELKFYIKYQAAKKDEKIIDKINPVIEINYAKKFSSSGGSSSGGSSGGGSSGGSPGSSSGGSTGGSSESSGSSALIYAYTYQSSSVTYRIGGNKNPFWRRFLDTAGGAGNSYHVAEVLFFPNCSHNQDVDDASKERDTFILQEKAAAATGGNVLPPDPSEPSNKYWKHSVGSLEWLVANYFGVVFDYDSKEIDIVEAGTPEDEIDESEFNKHTLYDASTKYDNSTTESGNWGSNGEIKLETNISELYKRWLKDAYDDPNRDIDLEIDVDAGYWVTGGDSPEDFKAQWYPDIDDVYLTIWRTDGEEGERWDIYDTVAGMTDSTGYTSYQEADDYRKTLPNAGDCTVVPGESEYGDYTYHGKFRVTPSNLSIPGITDHAEFTITVPHDGGSDDQDDGGSDDQDDGGSDDQTNWSDPDKCGVSWICAEANNYLYGCLYYGFEIKSAKAKESTKLMQPAVVLDEPTLRVTEPTEWGEEIPGGEPTPGEPTPGGSTPGNVVGAGSGENVIFGCKEFNMYLGGNAWQSLPTIKVGDFGNNQHDGSIPLSGIQVELWDSYNNTLKTVTTTDSDGEYGFQKLNPLRKYYVVFEYDGMRFEDVTYINNLQTGSGGYSLAQENDADRTNFNIRFSAIESSPQNYDSWKKAYGLYSKIEDSNQNYIQYNNYDKEDESNLGSFRYSDALDVFKDIATKNSNSNPYNLSDNPVVKRDFNLTNSTTMNSTYHIMRFGDNQGYDTLEEVFKTKLRQIGASESEISNIWTYMMDTMIRATSIAYPEENRFTLEDVNNPRDNSVIGYPYLYNSTKDQSRQLDFGVYLRTNADVWISKDLYKTTLLVNGKQQEYFYNKKKSKTDASGNWEIDLDTGTYLFKGPDLEDRASNADYVGQNYGGDTYTRELRKSEYLYDGSDVTGDEYDDIKNLQVFVTYKIAIKNQAPDIWTSIDELVDYYDSDQYEYFEVANNTIVKNNTFIGDAKGNKKYNVTISGTSRYLGKYGSEQGYYSNSSNINGINNYASLYITGIRDTNEDNMGNVRLKPSNFTYVYITFKVKNDPNTGKVKIDQDVDELVKGNVVDKYGKKNIIEVNGYSTFYYDGTRAGVIDLDSNPGSLKSRDIDGNGDIISSTNSWNNRLEDDTDKASNLKLKIDTVEVDKRSFSGYVFEDARTEISDQAVIGNGVYNENDVDVQGNKDKKVNGVTMQLVELVQEVNEEGFPTGNYTREHIWTSVVYQKNGADWTDVNASLQDPRYYSGTDRSKVIISGPGVFAENPSTLTLNQGEYRFDSLPPGDFFVRFIYGDTTQTVLTNVSDEVQDAFNKLTNEEKQALIQEANHDGILGTSGLNSISYTGQDYKSTIYQKGVNQDPTINNYNNIIGYINTETQNYNRDNANDKNAMYNYDIDESTIGEISDAKDVYSYREDEMRYSMGSNVNSAVEGMQTLKNHRSEVLSSGTQLTTKAKDDITSKVNVLIPEIYVDNNKENYVQATRDQYEAIKELINNTKMVAQTGVINIEVEYNRKSTDVFNKDDNDNVQYVQNLGYHLQDLDLGLTERPEAQLELSKELTNIQIRLANNQILFDTNQSVNNLIYGRHNEYTTEDYYYNVEKNNALAYRLRHDIQTKQKERQEELVYASMDEELMSGATVRLTYKISVDNIGEVDYLDKRFYYLGQTNNPGWENISRTNARRVIDYITNQANYEANYQNDVDDWALITTSVILGGDENEDNDLVNKLYEDNLNTFNVLVATNKLSGELIPRAIDTTEDARFSRKELYLVLSTLLSNTINDKNLVYTNLVEILEATNTNGRRMQLSRVGNQPMPYQSEQFSMDESSVWVHPQELDADSGQKVQITVPTGENRDYNRMIVIAISSLAIIGISIYVIKKKILKK